jgi:hypothetical protein
MSHNLEQRWQGALTELERTYDMMEAADMGMERHLDWLRKWLDIKGGQAANDPD